MNFAETFADTNAWIFLPLVIPICLWVAYTDLKDMKILNIAVGILLAGYVVLGPFALPSMEEYFWRFANFGVVLAIGFVLSVGVGIGAGDAKFAAAAAPFVAPADALPFLAIVALAGVGGLVLHRIAKRIPAIRSATPNWVSWQDGSLFPWGVALAGALAAYLVLGIAQSAA
ncbi:hypothetical protein HKCCE2091_07485 [Rhodobacterales bacterium HKCCE2091]|nr:hypothetical protein [Rhodobacterales bacterium HKCCE2091]